MRSNVIYICSVVLEKKFLHYYYIEMSDVDVHETIVDEQYIGNKTDELVLENIEPVSNTKRKTRSTKNFKRTKGTKKTHDLVSPKL